MSSPESVNLSGEPKHGGAANAHDLDHDGEVLVKVVFLANGSIEVVGVVHGLGHGLDESAISAAQKIKFKPAQREGAAIDYPATIHIVFELA